MSKHHFVLKVLDSNHDVVIRDMAISAKTYRDAHIVARDIISDRGIDASGYMLSISSKNYDTDIFVMKNGSVYDIFSTTKFLKGKNKGNEVTHEFQTVSGNTLVSKVKKVWSPRLGKYSYSCGLSMRSEYVDDNGLPEHLFTLLVRSGEDAARNMSGILSGFSEKPLPHLIRTFECKYGVDKDITALVKEINALKAKWHICITDVRENYFENLIGIYVEDASDALQLRLSN